jgi:hypothetical protein
MRRDLRAPDAMTIGGHGLTNRRHAGIRGATEAMHAVDLTHSFCANQRQRAQAGALLHATTQVIGCTCADGRRLRRDAS